MKKLDFAKFSMFSFDLKYTFHCGNMKFNIHKLSLPYMQN